MNKQNQSILDLLQTMPLSSFMVQRSPVSNKEAQTLYDIWRHGEKDEYGKHVLPNSVDPLQVTSLTTKGYIHNQASRFATLDGSPVRKCEFTDKGKDLIKQIILYKEQSTFNKESGVMDYESFYVANEMKKTAARIEPNVSKNWLMRTIWKSS